MKAESEAAKASSKRRSTMQARTTRIATEYRAILASAMIRITRISRRIIDSEPIAPRRNGSSAMASTSASGVARYLRRPRSPANSRLAPIDHTRATYSARKRMPKPTSTTARAARVSPDRSGSVAKMANRTAAMMVAATKRWVRVSPAR